MVNKKTKKITLTALMITLIFIGTFSIRFPKPATGGYLHIGDSMIFTSVIILGKRNGSIAGALGGALADLLCGATIWIIPTLFIKFIMAWIMASIIDKNFSSIIGAILGGFFQIFAYTIVEAFLFTWPAAWGALPGLTMQTIIGFLIFIVLFKMLQTTKLFNYIE